MKGIINMEERQKVEESWQNIFQRDNIKKNNN